MIDEIQAISSIWMRPDGNGQFSESYRSIAFDVNPTDNEYPTVQMFTVYNYMQEIGGKTKFK